MALLEITDLQMVYPNGHEALKLVALNWVVVMFGRKK